MNMNFMYGDFLKIFCLRWYKEHTSLVLVANHENLGPNNLDFNVDSREYLQTRSQINK